MRDPVWVEYERTFSDQISLIVRALCVANAIAAILNHLSANVLFTYLNTVLALLFLLVYRSRNRISTLQVVLLIVGTGYLLAITSLLTSGLVGSAGMVLAVVQVVAIVFLKLKPAILIGGVGVILFVGIGWFISRGIIPVDPQVFERVFAFPQWIVQTFVLATVGIVAISLVSQMRSRLLETIQKHREQAAALENFAYRDQLTGLPNRYRFREEVSRSMDDSGVSSGVLLLVDIRHFRVVNALYGTEIADQQLQNVATMLTGLNSKVGTVARVGDAEFAVWLPNASKEWIEHDYRQYRAESRRSLDERTPGPQIDLYKGLAQYPRDGTRFDECTQAAAIALQHAINRDERKLVWFEPGMKDASKRDQQIEQKVTEAFANNEFLLVYQPKVNLSSSRIVGLEALSRWNSSSVGPVNP